MPVFSKFQKQNTLRALYLPSRGRRALGRRVPVVALKQSGLAPIIESVFQDYQGGPPIHKALISISPTQKFVLYFRRDCSLKTNRVILSLDNSIVWRGDFLLFQIDSRNRLTNINSQRDEDTAMDAVISFARSLSQMDPQDANAGWLAVTLPEACKSSFALFGLLFSYLLPDITVDVFLQTLFSLVAAVNALSFSSSGEYLASGGDDKALILWDTSYGDLLQKIFTPAAITTLLWHPEQEGTLFFGCEDDCLAVDTKSGYLAIGVGSEVQVAKRLTDDDYATFVIMPPPSCVLPEGVEDFPVRPRSVHFLPGGRKLLVSYLSHGIVCWDVLKKCELWSIQPPKRYPLIGSSSISPDFRKVLVHNLSRGMDLYKLGCARPPAEAKMGRFAYGIKRQEFDSRPCHMESNICLLFMPSKLSHPSFTAYQTYQGRHLSMLASAASDDTLQTTIKIWKAPVGRTIFPQSLTEVKDSAMALLDICGDTLDTIPFHLKAIAISVACFAFAFAWKIDVMMYAHAISQIVRKVSRDLVVFCMAALEQTLIMLSMVQQKLNKWWIAVRPHVQKWLRDFLEDAE
ncbi:hypothetical protein NLJ89_g3530 [Agrocybe chaxingu]|uniref:Uncharacterized protein n=1 Tax=Agrocybe chaxingu TaxID=84603 RepID=A0A9W8MYG2_9AGAR|nr:hypothetical protein NLJ89_g3530 [Agrocybe chaxingu]